MSNLIQLLIISLSLSLDAFSVSVVGGIKTKKARVLNALKTAVFFGGFQFVMPLLGWVIGVNVHSIVHNVDHWIAFIILLIIGAKMIKDAHQEKKRVNMLSNKSLIILATATSIDALAVGITFNFIRLPLLLSAMCIGIVTFILCFIGFLFGKKLGTFFEGRVEIIGGIALIALGIKILIEHL